MAQLGQGAVMQPLLVGMAFSPDQGLGIHGAGMGQVGPGAAALQPVADAVAVPLLAAHPGHIAGVPRGMGRQGGGGGRGGGGGHGNGAAGCGVIL